MNPAQTAPSLERLTKLQVLTAEYSRFSDAKAGLTLIVAAALLVALRFLPNPTNFHGVFYVIVAALIWLAARARINQYLYQRFGNVQEKRKGNRWDFVFGALVGLTVTSLLISLLTRNDLVNLDWLTAPSRFAPLAIALLVSFNSFRKNRILDGGVIVFFGAMATGANNAATFTGFQQVSSVVLMLLLPLAFCIFGIKQHQQFRQIERELEQLRDQT
jgi:hypothetical protein